MSETDQEMRPAHRAPTLSLTFARWKTTCLEERNVDQKQTLRGESRAYFETLIQSTEVSLNDGEVLKSKSSHNEALAQLIADLGPAFSTHQHVSRVCALYTLCGAIEGCGGGGFVSVKITALFGTFLLGHCGPIEPDMDDPDEDTDEMVRDAAVLCMGALLRAKVDDDDNDEQILESIQQRLDLAKNGVEKRCAAPDNDDMDYDHGYGESSMPVQDIGGGLSTLPRSRRSLCFDLLQAAVDGTAALLASTDGSNVEFDSLTLQRQMFSFTSFAATCLHGESDPRCLLQLLRLLSASQRTFSHRFKTSVDDKDIAVFPTLDIFDAVAPYYPIQFTPPPNDVHGITREDLHNALMAVLSNVQDDQMSRSKNGEGRETMLNLSTGLFLERLVPRDSEDGSMSRTLVDKREALEDISSLLFPMDKPSNCEMLHQDTVRELSSALFTVHADASSSASSGGGEAKRNKALADECRTLVSRVAYQLEVTGEGKETLWDTFVKDAVHAQSPILSTSPQSMRGRTAIAYLACLAASGGKRTLTLCLNSCLGPLLEALTSDLHDDEKVAAAAYGVGAMFSSYRVAQERNKDGVSLHPNPLETYGSKAIGGLCQVLGMTSKELDYDNPDIVFSSVTTRRAAICTLESVLLTTPPGGLEQEDCDRICRLIELLSETILGGGDACYEGDSHAMEIDSEYTMACARTLGSVVGKALNKDNNNGEEGPSHSNTFGDASIRSFIEDSVYPKVMSAALAKPKSRFYGNVHWMTLAFACKMSDHVSHKVLSTLVKSLGDALTDERDADSEVSSMALSCVLRNGGPCARAAFHELSPPDTTSIDIISALCSPLKTLSPTNEREPLVDPILSRAGVSKLELPATSEEREKIEKAFQRAHRILPNLLPAYRYSNPVPQQLILELAKHASQVLPPISEWDNLNVHIALILLAEALSNDPRTQNSDAECSILLSMVPAFAEYTLSSSYDQRARAAAASCLHSVITGFQPASSKECLSYVAMKQVVLPAVVAVADEIRANEELQPNSLTACKDALNLSALLGSAAACRGKSSAQVADEIALFLIQLSCTGKVDAPVNMDISGTGVKNHHEWTTWPAPLYIASASAFGSMLSVENGGPFWRQRLSYLAIKPVLSACSHDSSSAEAAEPPVGPLVIACHIFCSCEPAAIGKTNMSELASIIILGVAACVKPYASGTADAVIRSTVALVLAASIKLISVAPETVSKNVSAIVQNYLLLFSGGDRVDDTEEIPLKLLVLQGLLNLAALPGAKRSLMPFKPAVLSLLSDCLDNSSALLRQAAVDVSNSWSILKP